MENELILCDHPEETSVMELEINIKDNRGSVLKLPMFYYTIDHDVAYSGDDVMSFCKDAFNDGIENAILNLDNEFTGYEYETFREHYKKLLKASMISVY